MGIRAALPVSTSRRADTPHGAEQSERESARRHPRLAGTRRIPAVPAALGTPSSAPSVRNQTNSRLGGRADGCKPAACVRPAPCSRRESPVRQGEYLRSRVGEGRLEMRNGRDLRSCPCRACCSGRGWRLQSGLCSVILRAAPHHGPSGLRSSGTGQYPDPREPLGIGRRPARGRASCDRVTTDHPRQHCHLRLMTRASGDPRSTSQRCPTCGPPPRRTGLRRRHPTVGRVVNPRQHLDQQQSGGPACGIEPDGERSVDPGDGAGEGGDVLGPVLSCDQGCDSRCRIQRRPAHNSSPAW